MPQAVFADDPRRPIERLRRFQLWRIADRHGIHYPKDAAKSVMIQILDGANVDVTREDLVNWKTVSLKDEKGDTVQQAYPDEPKRGGLDNAALSRFMQEKEAQEQEKEKLKETNSGLEEQLSKAVGIIEGLESRLAALENPKKTGVARLNDLRKQCKAQGIPYSRSDKTADLERKLEEAA